MSYGEVKIDFAHEMIHEGRHFMPPGFEELANIDDTKVFHITTSDSPELAHLTVKGRPQGETEIHIYKNPDVTGGDAETIINRNQSSTRESGLTIVSDPTITDNGTEIYSESVGDGQKIGSDFRGDSEIVLAKSTEYLIVITTKANTNKIFWLLDWYEKKVH